LRGKSDGQAIIYAAGRGDAMAVRYFSTYRPPAATAPLSQG
jgi:hypothetical protein